RTLRDLADLADIQHTLDSADPRTLENRLARLTLPECAWRPLAMQTLALLQIREGKTKEAADTLRQIQTDVTAPENARQMASTLLQAIA
ncbi:hypothetical protein ABI063_14705, partial [Enterococcus faecium]|uniref:hypothetical protein n=1 Tax=Enterococcus faecium TaxID=1352 RepID=UPI003F421B1B